MAQNDLKPGVNDLRWEVIRRSCEYWNDFEQHGDTMKMREKWDVLRMEYPDTAWDETVLALPSGQTIAISPCCTGSGAPMMCWTPGIRSEDITRTPGKKSLIVEIDPWENLDSIKAKIGTLVEIYRKAINKPPPKQKITERIAWLEIVDAILAKNPKPTAKTFRGANRRVQMRRYAKGRLLIENPFLDPMRPITDKAAETYLRTAFPTS